MNHKAGHQVNYIRENGRIIVQFIFTLLFFSLGIWFINHEQTELRDVKNVLLSSRLFWLGMGLSITAVYVMLQGLMYKASFRSVGIRTKLTDTVILFLKRNFISVFLPAGGVSSLAFFTSDFENKGVTKSQIHFASTIYGLVGILSVIIIAIPAFLYGLLQGETNHDEWLALASIALLLFLAYVLIRSIYRKSWTYLKLIRWFPSLEAFVEDITSSKISKGYFILTVIYSTLIEISGITIVFVSLKALQFDSSLYVSAMGYIVAVIFMIISPFMKGLGAVEVSMAFVLTRFGFSSTASIAITLLYRFFEFWIPLFAGILAFLSKINKLLFRIIPAFLIFLLGLINIISVLTPSIGLRVERLQEFFMMDAIRASNYFVLAAGLFLLITAAFMLKGLKIAWWIGIILSGISLIGHITKAIDYEEASVAAFVIVVLILTKKEYYIRNNPKLRSVGLQGAVLSILVVLLYGTTGFYFLDKVHFNIDFNLMQSFKYTFQCYFMVSSHDLVPQDAFARNFLLSINISGFLSIAFLIYTLVRPYVLRFSSSSGDLLKADELLNRYGKTSLDYFKTYSDKLIFFAESVNAFIAYRIAGNFALVLEDPVAEDKNAARKCIDSFDEFCDQNGLKDVYYRVPESSLPLYRSMGKKQMFIGQEAVMDLHTFTLEGGSKKSIRNAINKVRDQEYRCAIHQPPIKDGLLQKLKHVSSEWLHDTHRNEIVFSQGMFSWEELKNQVILTVENPEEKVVAFLNVVPDFVPNEATYDLIRKTSDAPGGVMDYLLIELFSYLKTQGFHYVNLGFAPMSGIDDPHSFTERSMKFAYNKIRSFSHYRGLREYKEKFDPVWQNRYLVYDHDFDLFKIPATISKVIHP